MKPNEKRGSAEAERALAPILKAVAEHNITRDEIAQARSEKAGAHYFRQERGVWLSTDRTAAKLPSFGNGLLLIETVNSIVIARSLCSSPKSK